MADELSPINVVTTETEVEGAINVVVNGEPRRIPCTMKKIETRHPSGRVDVTIQVPRLAMGTKKEQ